MPKSDLLAVLGQRATESGVDVVSNEADIAYDAMFGIKRKKADQTISMLRLSDLVGYTKHPFKAYQGDQLQMLAKSIFQQGLQQPIIVRPLAEDKYEILAGHNRVEAFRLNKQNIIPAIVVFADSEQAAMIVTETNLRQRQKLLPSEKAFAYKLQMHAAKCRVENNDGALGPNTSSDLAQVELRHSRDIVAAQNAVDKNEITRHIRLTCLHPNLLQLVDENKLAFIAAVGLSYLSEVQQETIYQYFIVEHRDKLSIEIVNCIRGAIDKGNSCDDKDSLDSVYARLRE